MHFIQRRHPPKCSSVSSLTKLANFKLTIFRYVAVIPHLFHFAAFFPNKTHLIIFLFIIEMKTLLAALLFTSHYSAPPRPRLPPPSPRPSQSFSPQSSSLFFASVAADRRTEVKEGPLHPSTLREKVAASSCPDIRLIAVRGSLGDAGGPR